MKEVSETMGKEVMKVFYDFMDRTGNGKQPFSGQRGRR
jgi:hypothetical protein